MFLMQLNKGYPSLTVCDGHPSSVLLLFTFRDPGTLSTANQRPCYSFKMDTEVVSH